MVTLRRSLPPLNALVVFEAAARHGNLTTAGAELCIAASAVSRHVANLERDTGLALFTRTGNRLELTAAGKRLAEAVATGMGHVRDILTELKRRAATQTLTIGCSYDTAHSWLMPRFRSIAELVVDRQLRLITSDTYENFDSPDVDLSVRYGDGHWPGFASAHLFAEECFPICSPDLLTRHPELREPSVDTLMRFPLLQLTTDDWAGLKWADWLRELGAELPVIKGPVFANYSLLLLELVAGRGLAMGFAHVVDQLLADGRVVRLSERTIRSGLGMYAVYRESDAEQIEPVVKILTAARDETTGMRG